MRRIQIADLDGCISDDRHRRRHLDPMLIHNNAPEAEAARNAMFDAYHRDCLRDEAHNLEFIREEHVVFLTGRPVKWYEPTSLWLAEQGIRSLFIIMRNNFDHTPSVELKKRMVYALLDANSYNIQREELVLAIDDREDVVTMYRTIFGLDAHVVRIGDEEHRHG